MAKQELITNFSGGLLGAKLRGRYDIERYKSGCKTLTNMVVTPQGIAQKRPGTYYVASQKTIGEKIRLLPFVFSATDAIVIEMGVGYFRFYKDGVQITSGGIPYEISHSYTEDQLYEVSVVQCMDILYLCHQDHHPKQLSRYADTIWSFTDINLEDGPYWDINTTDVTIDHGTISGLKSNYRGVAAGGTWLVATGSAVMKGGAVQSVCNISTDNVTWEKKSMSGTHSYNSVRYLNNLFVFAGHSGTVKTLANGTTFTGRNTGTNTNLNDSCFDGTLYYFVGDSGVIRTATTGWSFTARTSGVTTRLNCIAYDGSAKVIAVGDRGVILSCSTGNPAVWTQQASGVTTDINSIAYNSTISMWCAVGDSGVILTSTDGVIWTQQTSGISVDLNGVMSYSGGFIAVGDDGYIITSMYGINWIIRNHLRSITLRSVAYLSTMLVAVGSQGMIAVSTDGVTWTYRGMQTATITATDDIFKPDRDEGRHIRLSSKGVWTWGKILSIPDERSAIIDIRGRFYGSKSTDIWQLGAFYTGNYPKCGAFYQERFFMANTPLQPQTIWGSCSGDFVNFAPTTFEGGIKEKETKGGKKIVKAIRMEPGEVVDSSSLTYVMGSNEMAFIEWMRGEYGLIVGCVGGIFRIDSAEAGMPLTPTSVDCKEQGAAGVKAVDPVKVGNVFVYVQSMGKTASLLYFSGDEKKYISSSLSTHCDEITGTGICATAYQKEPYSIVWMVRNDGYLAGCTVDLPNKIAAWHYHNTVGTFEDCVCIPGTNEDEVWLVVNRLIGGVATRCIEYMKPFNFDAAIADAYFVDCGITQDSTLTTSISGVSHLNGLDCAVLGDGLVQANVVPSGGIATIETAARTAHIGLPYTSELSTMDIQPGGSMKRIIRAVAMLHETGFAKIGRDSTKCDITPGLTAGVLHSIDTKDISFPSGYDRDAYVYVMSDKPLPLSVLGIKTVWERI